MSKPETFIDIDALAIGHYVHLDLSWMDHPFAMSHFKVSSPDQIRTIRSLGLKKVRVDLDKSTPVAPTAEQIAKPEPTPEEAELAALQAAAMAQKRERIAQNQALRSRISASEKQFMEGAKICKDVARTIFASPAETLGKVSQLIEKITAALMTDKEAIIHLLGDKIAGEEVYNHSLNVATLVMMLSKELKLPKEVIEETGLATILHDLGKVELPSRVLLKKEAWTKPERDLYETHVQHGVTIAAKAGVPKEVLEIIAQHHEVIDGSGFPRKLKAAQICLGAKLLSVVDTYDNLCNPVNINNALTPHEALSLMFTKQRARYDAVVLGKLVHMLGVYPPGTVVVLSNDSIGMVLAVNASKPLRPIVMLYDPEIPRAEAMSINLEEEKDINISKALRPAQLPRAVYDYLSPRQRITYSFDSSAHAGK